MFKQLLTLYKPTLFTFKKKKKYAVVVTGYTLLKGNDNHESCGFTRKCFLLLHGSLPRVV